MGVWLAYVWKHVVKVACLQFAMKKVLEKEEEMALTSLKKCEKTLLRSNLVHQTTSVLHVSPLKEVRDLGHSDKYH